MTTNLRAAGILVLIAFGLLAVQIVRERGPSLFGKGWLILIVISIAALLVLLVLLVWHSSRA